MQRALTRPLLTALYPQSQGQGLGQVYLLPQGQLHSLPILIIILYCLAYKIPVKTGFWQLAANAWWLGPRLMVDRILTFLGSSSGFDRLFFHFLHVFSQSQKSAQKKSIPTRGPTKGTKNSSQDYSAVLSHSCFWKEIASCPMEQQGWGSCVQWHQERGPLDSGGTGDEPCAQRCWQQSCLF